MYQFSYNEVIEESRGSMRDQERHAMSRVIDMMRAVREKDIASPEAVEAFFYLRRLWSIFMDDLKEPENELPDPVRNSLLSIGIWINKEIDRIRSGQTADLMPLIEINEIVRDGLN